MILSFRSSHLEVFASTQDGYFDHGRDEYVIVKPGFRMRLGKFVWDGGWKRLENV